MTAIWIALGLAATVVVGFLVRSSRDRSDGGELGSVSERWLSEERANDRPYSKP